MKRLTACLLCVLTTVVMQAADTPRQTHAEALLHAERVLLVTPGDPSALATLHEATTRGIPGPQDDFAERIARRLPPSAPELAACIAFWTMMAALTWPSAKTRRHSPRRVAVAASAATMLALAAPLIHARGTLLDRAVVMTHDCPLRPTPSVHAESIGTLRVGERIRLTGDRHGDHLAVTTASGTPGWIEAAALRPLMPPT